jgi:group II intron reverse transcriptase/maturase
MRQKSGEQLELALEDRGEAPKDQRSGEARKTAQGTGRSGVAPRLMERVVERANMLAAYRRVRQNKGSPGVDGMTVEDLRKRLWKDWDEIRELLLAGTYQPQPVKRQEIKKPGGGTRQLGIPTVLDRLIQQCLLQVLQPIFDPTFSDHSYGSRPGRSAHDAVCAAQGYIQSGRRWVADVDLEKFFDGVNHDVTMERASRKIGDPRVLRLIRRYLEAGMFANGIVVDRYEGTPQGGPLSPLLANVLLDEVDKELENRGLTFARYVDDLNVYTGSRRAAEDAMATLRKLLGALRLRVNESKSTVARVWQRKFLGYSFWIAPGRVVRPRVAPAALRKMKQRVRAITRRSGGRSLPIVAKELRDYLIGWKNYFQLARTPGIFKDLDGWILRRLRAVQIKQWKRGTTVYRELRARGVPERLAKAGAAHARRWWAMATHGAFKTALPISYFDRLGVPHLSGR